MGWVGERRDRELIARARAALASRTARRLFTRVGVTRARVEAGATRKHHRILNFELTSFETTPVIIGELDRRSQPTRALEPRRLKAKKSPFETSTRRGHADRVARLTESRSKGGRAFARLLFTRVRVRDTMPTPPNKENGGAAANATSRAASGGARAAAKATTMPRSLASMRQDPFANVFKLCGLDQMRDVTTEGDVATIVDRCARWFRV